MFAYSKPTVVRRARLLGMLESGQRLIFKGSGIVEWQPRGFRNSRHGFRQARSANDFRQVSNLNDVHEDGMLQRRICSAPSTQKNIRASATKWGDRTVLFHLLGYRTTERPRSQASAVRCVSRVLNSGFCWLICRMGSGPQLIAGRLLLSGDSSANRLESFDGANEVWSRAWPSRWLPKSRRVGTAKRNKGRSILSVLQCLGAPPGSLEQVSHEMGKLRGSPGLSGRARNVWC